MFDRFSLEERLILLKRAEAVKRLKQIARNFPENFACVRVNVRLN